MDADYLIVGAGCAGLSLGVHLLARGPRRGRLLLLEPRETYGSDRTFCFWKTDSHPFSSCVSHEWFRWRVAARQREVVRGAPKIPYQHIPGESFYAEALRRLEPSPRVELRRGVRVETLLDRGDHVEALTSQGTVRARVAFDSRRPPPTAASSLEIRFLQHFRGWLVRTEWPSFDPSVATLMDFADGPDIHFFYVLPFDRHHALVEDTWFSSAPLPEATYEASLREYLDRLLAGGAYEVLQSEAGVIPMTTEPMPRSASPRIVPIGLAGGVAKPSTGYAFLFIQRHSERLARRLRRGAPPSAAAPRSFDASALDRIFLSYLRSHPERAPGTFLQLFENVRPKALVRFLSEKASLLERMEVMSALPTLDFVGEAARSRRLWLRRS